MADCQHKQVAASGKKGAFLPLPAAYLYTIHRFPSSKAQSLAIFHITSFVEKPEGLEANVLHHKQAVYMHTCVDTQHADCIALCPGTNWCILLQSQQKSLAELPLEWAGSVFR
jgi:hypothetical protein